MRNLLFLLLLGLVVYAVITLVLRVRSGPVGPSGPAGPPRSGGWRPKRPSGPVAPDDDPEFLWLLEQQQRQADRDAMKDQKDDDGSDHPDPRDTTA
ncbi:hypothetical protein [Pengzhenrongella frigida]|uniref:hypothetical protein n=1 Tax=Pengzhenrongella frigida TaxID=1259133 RepID=UPI001A92961A|nr:hypothetical protein [Cellulomonas sp. HLT2-17]